MSIDKFECLPDGIYVPVPTFFKNDEDYTLDLDNQLRHVKFLYGCGINGVVLAGSMGESCHLTGEERSLLCATVRKAIPDPNFKIVLGSPPLSIQDTTKEIHDGYNAGANFSLLLVPGYFGPHLTSQQGIIDYFNLVARNLPLPIIIYNYPGVSNNVTLSLDTFKQLLQIPQIVGVKLTHFNLDLYILLASEDKQYKLKNFKPFTGLGQVLVPAMSIGVKGAIDGLANVFPKSMLRILELYKQCQYEEVAKLQYQVTRANQMISELNVVGIKLALKEIYGFGDCTSGRPPLNREANKEIYLKYSKDLAALLEIEKSI
ncbi:uncharacterized protein PRCAT00005829001 [Priceomyces carsonii]|uniref:uncharacterized protein n=1 Tax=Priceomyces carsonii TaxID=28549 RepID=UPI002EDA5C80|nr:unnamed protein product [Priceomyces carsonii]